MLTRSQKSTDEPSSQDRYSLTKDDMVWFWDHYLPNEDNGKHPYASPLQAQDLSNLPPVMIISAEFDPLRDEGKQYADLLQEAGNQATLMCNNGMIHGFFGLGL